MSAGEGAGAIGVFDSGVGGLTVLGALRRRLPGARFLYLGDTARLPYGSKSRATVARYAVEAGRFLVGQGAEYLVIACNTASALAMEELREALPVPVLGVVDAGARAARGRSRSLDACVLATTATVESHAYRAACGALGMRVVEAACPLLVPLVEEGWTAHAVTREVLRLYLEEAEAAWRKAGLQPDALVLGCTHYPLLREEMERLVPAGMAVIDSAEVTAEAVAGMVGGFVAGVAAGAEASGRLGFEAAGGSSARAGEGAGWGAVRFFATDGAERFRVLGSRFLGEPIAQVDLVDLGG